LKDAACAAARANGDTRRLERLEHSATLNNVFVDSIQTMLQSRTGTPDTEVLARRIAGYMAGPPAVLWQYIAVNVVPAFPLDLFGGWELAPISPAHDEKTPLWYSHTTPYDPAAHHFDNDYGALRRSSGEQEFPAEESDCSDPVLLWPLIALNLYSDYPVHAGVSYYVEQGRRIVPRPETEAQPSEWAFMPKELRRWEYTAGQLVLPRKGRTIDATASDRLRMFASGFGARLQGLDDKQRARFARAADQYLIVVYRTPGPAGNPPAIPSMHAPEAAFRWISAIEGLLSDGDDRSDLKRKTAQRAAVLAGQDDAGRLAVSGLVNAAYGVRSAYAHGGQPKTADLGKLRSLTRHVMVSWTVLATEHPAKALPKVLDEALLSRRVREDMVQQPLRRFLEQAMPGQ
jgi:hypothetical protein